MRGRGGGMFARAARRCGVRLRMQARRETTDVTTREGEAGVVEQTFMPGTPATPNPGLPPIGTAHAELDPDPFGYRNDPAQMAPGAMFSQQPRQRIGMADEDAPRAEGWIYPGVHRADAPSVAPNGEVYMPREYGIFDGPQKVTNLLDKAPYVAIKEPMPKSLRVSRPSPEDSAATLNDAGTAVSVRGEQRVWLLSSVVDRSTWEDALGEQLFRSQDLDRNSTMLFPVGYGLPPHTTALIVEDEEAGEQFHHLCGGRSDHVVMVEGFCYTMRVDIENFLHVLNYFGECWGVAGDREKYHHKYRGLCIWGKGMDPEDAEFIDGFFGFCGLNMAVDLERLDEACEGYVPVVYSPRNGMPALSTGPGGWGPHATGVFIWQNFLQSVVSMVDKRSRTQKLFTSFGTQRDFKNLKARVLDPNVINPKASESIAEYVSKYGAGGAKLAKRRAFCESVDDGSAGAELPNVSAREFTRAAVQEYENVTDWHMHGFAHPMFTTEPESDR